MNTRDSEIAISYEAVRWAEKQRATLFVDALTKWGHTIDTSGLWEMISDYRFTVLCQRIEIFKRDRKPDIKIQDAISAKKWFNDLDECDDPFKDYVQQIATDTEWLLGDANTNPETRQLFIGIIALCLETSETIPTTMNHAERSDPVIPQVIYIYSEWGENAARITALFSQREQMQSLFAPHLKACRQRSPLERRIHTYVERASRLIGFTRKIVRWALGEK